MIPRILRWDVHSQQGDSDLESWFQYFNDAGTKFLGFLNSRKATRLQVLDREFKELKDKLSSFKNTAEYNSLSSNLQSFLEKADRDQKNKKHKKYSCDAGDYKSEMVFGWQKSMVSATIPASLVNTDGNGVHPVASNIGTDHSHNTQLGPTPPPLKVIYTNKGVIHFRKKVGFQVIIPLYLNLEEAVLTATKVEGEVALKATNGTPIFRIALNMASVDTTTLQGELEIIQHPTI